MAIDLTPEQRELGKANFARVSEGLSRRGFMKSLAIAGGAVVPVSAAVYFGYESLHGKPVKAAIIGTGDEGGVLVGEHNPEFIEFVAACDIRPSNQKRIMEGDPKVPIRKGFRKIYGNDADKIKMYTDYKDVLARKDIEAVVIAVPLIQHAPIAIEAMKASKHVLCEKLMAWNITQCKEMIRVAKETNRILSIGHQRHYSLLYAHASEIINAGVLGDIKHIRALWHRNNSWPYVPPNPKDVAEGKEPKLKPGSEPALRDGWYNPILLEDADALDAAKLRKYGYKSIEELVRWRLFQRTGGGLMAELGSHQLDACSIFLGKVHPLAVSGVGGKTFYGPGKNDRDVDDHVFATYEFPGKNYANDKNDIVIVTYSSISTNSFEAYGECVMGSRGTMVVEQEQSVMVYPEKDPNKKGGGAPKATTVGVAAAGGDKPALDASSTWGPPAAQAGAATGPVGAGGAPVSRGYREEMEDFAYCIRMWDQAMEKDRRLPRCHGKVAMADAIVSLTANLAMKKRQRIEFKPEWFDAASAEVPDGEMKVENIGGETA